MTEMLNLTGRQREFVSIDVTVLNVAGDPVNLTTFPTLTWVIAASFDGPPLATLSIGDGITVLDGPNGQALIKFKPDAPTFPPGLYRHQARVTVAGDTFPVLHGSMTVLPSIYAS